MIIDPRMQGANHRSRQTKSKGAKTHVSVHVKFHIWNRHSAIGAFRIYATHYTGLWEPETRGGRG